LNANGVAYTINPRLVRGMDYYNLTVFEFVTTRLGSQGTVCAGGRYDYLVEQIGGRPAPAVGWAMGVERVLELLRDSGKAPEKRALHAYALVADVKDYGAVLTQIQMLRARGISVQMQASGTEGLPSLKSQFKKADVSGARYALIFGADEMAAARVGVKNLRDASVEQQNLTWADLGAWADHLQSGTSQ
jgi:histidyl-tRNA synthetase